MEKRLTIFFVAFEFPPLGGAGVQRSLKFVKYLHDFNINPVVITIKEDDYPKVLGSHAMDPSLCKDIPPHTIIERIHCRAPKEDANPLVKWMRMYFSISENFKTTWKPALEKQLPGLLEKYKPDAIYVSLPPFAMGSLWLSLLKPYSIPLIADFRDAWSQWCIAPNGSYFHYLAKLRAEENILRRADKVIFSSLQSKLDMEAVHPSVAHDKFNVITNGYDELLDLPETLRLSPGGKLVIAYVGSFYYTPEARKALLQPWYKKPPHRMINYVPRKEDWLYRSPYFFFKALRSLFNQQPSLENKLEIRFAGHTPNWLKEQINEFGLASICSHNGYLRHAEVIRFQQEADILLITSSKVIGGRDYSIAGKTFEYFTIQKPILAFVTEGAQKDILQETGMSVICDPDDTPGSVEKMKALLAGDLPLYPNKEALKKYHRKNLTEKLSVVIREAVNAK